MASPMVRVPEALKEVVQKLAEIHRQGDKRREVEAGLQRLLAELSQDREHIEEKDPTPDPGEPIQDVTPLNTPDSSGKGPDSLDTASDSVSDSMAANTADSKIDSKTASTSVVTSDIINVEEVVNRLAILEEKLAALEPQARTDSSTADRADDTVDNIADDKSDSSTDATSS